MYCYDDFILVVSTWVQQSKSVRTRGSKSCRKTSLQNCQILENLLGNIEIFPSWNPIFLARNPIFLNDFPTFFNGFLLSSPAFRFLQLLSSFPLSKKSNKIYLRRQVYKRWLFKLRISATHSPSFVIPTTMSTSPQQWSCPPGLVYVYRKKEHKSVKAGNGSCVVGW